jgi:cytochrome c553
MQRMICVAVVATVFAMADASGADLAAGKSKSALCLACHNANGISSNPQYPNLAGQQVAYLLKQMQAFRSAQRSNATMNSMMKLLTDTDMQNLAAYYASLASCGKPAASASR